MTFVLLNDIHSQLNETRVDRVIPVGSQEAVQSAVLDAARNEKNISISGGRYQSIHTKSRRRERQHRNPQTLRAFA